MSNYQFNLSHEGNLDTSLINGFSIQRTGYIETTNNHNKKISSVKDGKYFNDNPQSISDLEFVTSIENYAFRIVDNTNTNTDKMIRIYIKNVASDFSENYIVWKRFIINNTYAYFDFLGTDYISGHLRDSYFSPVPTTKGKKYIVKNGDLVEFGNAASMGQVDVYNDDSNDNLYIDVSRNGNNIENIIITPNHKKSFSYRPTFWIHASENLIDDPNISDVNTEVSVLGINTADIVLSSTEDVYSFGLSNITFA